MPSPKQSLSYHSYLAGCGLKLGEVTDLFTHLPSWSIWLQRAGLYNYYWMVCSSPIAMPGPLLVSQGWIPVGIIYVVTSFLRLGSAFFLSSFWALPCLWLLEWDPCYPKLIAITSPSPQTYWLKPLYDAGRLLSFRCLLPWVKFLPDPHWWLPLRCSPCSPHCLTASTINYHHLPPYEYRVRLSPSFLTSFCCVSPTSKSSIVFT
jgi:hypothetical protein